MCPPSASAGPPSVCSSTAGSFASASTCPWGPSSSSTSVDDPYHCGAPLTAASMYRRPLPSTNLRFLSAVMWDGRESSPDHDDPAGPRQAGRRCDARGMRRRRSTSHRRRRRRSWHSRPACSPRRCATTDAGSLRADGAKGGPVALSQQPFFIGINDPVGLNPTGAPFDPNAVTLFNAWAAWRTTRFSTHPARHRARPAGLQHEADRDLAVSPGSTTRPSRTASRCRSRSPARARRVMTRRTRATTR